MFNIGFFSLREINNNKGIKLKLLVALFRLASFFYVSAYFKIVFLPFFLLYRAYSEIVIGMDLSPKTKIGRGLKIYHGYGLVIHPDVEMGKNCTLRQGVTIGNKMGFDGVSTRSPRIGDNVEFGANSIVIGDIEIGSNVIIGAGVVVTKSIPDGSVVVGQGFRIL